MLTFAQRPVSDLIPDLLQLACGDRQTERRSLGREIFRPRQDGYNAKADVGFGRPKKLPLRGVDYDEMTKEYISPAPDQQG
jgi:hypothetical protein